MISLFRSKSLDPAIKRMLEQGELSPTERSWLDRLSTPVHKNESGYLDDGGQHYLKVGLSAMDCIKQALRKSEIESPSSILDFPCGYGRVARFLRAAYPDADLRGADLDKQAIQFCKKALGFDTSLSNKDFDTLNLGRSFDLIWCGSLVTHLDRERIASLFRFFVRHLSNHGVCVFTSHGVRVEGLLERGEINYSLSPDLVEKVLQGYKETGAGFSEYNQSRDGYGISLTSDSVIRELAAEAGNWECTLFVPAGWDNHQDVYAFKKA